MASNKKRFRRNINGATTTLLYPGKFQAGSTATCKVGELIELTAATNTCWIPMDSDFAGAGNVAVAHAEIKAADRGGYYPIEVPRPGDIFEYALATAGNSAIGTALYWSDSETVTTSGSNALAYVADHDNYPIQGHLSAGDLLDAGTTLRTVSYVGISIKLAASYYAAIVVA